VWRTHHNGAVSPRRWRPAVLLIAVALVAGCGDSGSRAKPAVSTPDAQAGIVYGKIPADPPTGTTTPFSTRGCQGCPPGTATQEAASLAPGAQRIAFTRATAVDEADIWIADADGSGELRLTRDAGLEMSPTWSPDGHRIAFVSDRAGGNLDLYAIATDGTGLVRLTDTPGDEFSPAWSPDGRTIAVTRSLNNDADVMLVDVGAKTERRLASGQWASWMPDSRGVLVTEGPFSKGRLVLIDTTTGARQPLEIDVPNAHQGSLSPDGRTVVFSVSENGFDGVPNDWNEELWTARTSDGGNLRRLTTRSGNDHWPVSWAPDGKSLVWTADDTEGGADLYIARANGKGVRRLTSDPGYDAWPSWAPRP
jgi:TolB protein